MTLCQIRRIHNRLWLGAQEDLLAVDRGGGYMGWRYVFNLDGAQANDITQ